VTFDKSCDEAGLTKDANGFWRPTFIIRDATEQELKDREEMCAAGERLIRSGLLLDSDFFDKIDSPLSEKQKEEYIIYRQALRDITKQPGFPFNIQWPELPK
jgi:hypothetical protein